MVVVVVVVAERPSTFPMQNLLPCYNIQTCIRLRYKFSPIHRPYYKQFINYIYRGCSRAFMGNLNARRIYVKVYKIFKVAKSCGS